MNTIKKVICLVLIQVQYITQLILIDNYRDRDIESISRLSNIKYAEILVFDRNKFNDITNVSITPDANTTY